MTESPSTGKRHLHLVPSEGIIETAPVEEQAGSVGLEVQRVLHEEWERRAGHLTAITEQGIEEMGRLGREVQVACGGRWNARAVAMTHTRAQAWATRELQRQREQA